ncbi:hypothetical protein [Dasychira pudibunda nucleopolyhedrovirus]|nr:hypothetical protein [Dasychira pudibunda nucleopolyhedrovirus]WHM28321.1 hypothetical protein [Dasychira pudibunda nucleopolyhedrovirus]
MATAFYYSQEYMYVSTISDIAAPLRVRIQPGAYTCARVAGRRGFQFAQTHSTLAIGNMVKLYAARSHDAGLSNTYYGGEIRDKNLVGLICDNFLKDVPDRVQYRLFCQETVVDAKVDHSNLYDSFELIERQLQQKYECADVAAHFREHGFCEYNNLPILLFLTTVVAETDFDKLGFVANERFGGDEHRTYRVELAGAAIGVLVHAKKFYSMYGDQMGLAAYSTDGLHVHAFANFEPKTQQEWDKIDACIY